MSKRSQLVENISAELGCSKKDADGLLLTVVACLQEQLKTGGEAVLPGFGRLSIKERAARKGHNPKTGEVIDIPAKSVVAFKPFPGVLGGTGSVTVVDEAE